VREPLLDGATLAVAVLHLEAGQSHRPEPGEAAYQVLEGDAAFRSGGASETARKGSVLVGEPEVIENLGGGLLVILETRAHS
jgi:hypothetical protein